MSTIVIGGNGFIGRYVVQRLLEHGKNVTIIGRSRKSLHKKDKRITYIKGDYSNIEVLRNLLRSGSEVIDLAYSTVPKTSFEDPLFDLTSNLPTSVALLREAQRVGIRRVIIVSSGGTVYGPVASLPITENHQTRPISPYGITKLAIDLYAMMYYRNEGLPVIIVRPSNAYGSDQKIGTGQGFLPAAINAIHTNKEVEIYGEHGTIRDYIHVSDVASGILAALYNGMEGNIYNIGTGVGTSNSEIFDMLKKLAYRDGLKARKRIVQPRRFDVEANILDSSKLEKECGWIPQIKLKDGIIRMWNDALLK